MPLPTEDLCLRRDSAQRGGVGALAAPHPRADETRRVPALRRTGRTDASPCDGSPEPGHGAGASLARAGDRHDRRGQPVGHQPARPRSGVPHRRSLTPVRRSGRRADSGTHRRGSDLQLATIAERGRRVAAAGDQTVDRRLRHWLVVAGSAAGDDGGRTETRQSVRRPTPGRSAVDRHRAFDGRARAQPGRLARRRGSRGRRDPECPARLRLRHHSGLRALPSASRRRTGSLDAGARSMGSGGQGHVASRGQPRPHPPQCLGDVGGGACE